MANCFVTQSIRKKKKKEGTEKETEKEKKTLQLGEQVPWGILDTIVQKSKCHLQAFWLKIQRLSMIEKKLKTNGWNDGRADGRTDRQDLRGEDAYKKDLFCPCGKFDKHEPRNTCQVT